MTEDEMFGWHQLDGHEFEQALGVGDGQGSLACYGPQGRKELDTTEQLNWTDMEIESRVWGCESHLISCVSFLKVICEISGKSSKM